MGVISEALKGGVVGEVARTANDRYITVAKVTKTDEDNNLCSISFVDRYGSAADITHASVDFRNENWFPSVKDNVLVEVSGSNSALIMSQYSEDPNKDIRSKRKYSKDISPDGDNVCAGQIF